MATTQHKNQNNRAEYGRSRQGANPQSRGSHNQSMQNRAQQKKKQIAKKKKRQQILRRRVLFASIVAVLVFLFLFIDYKSRVYTQCVIEAGQSALTPEDFQKNSSKKVSFAKDFDINSIPLHTPGQYTIRLKSGIYSYSSLLTIEDTTAPSGTASNVVLEYGNTCAPSAFVKDIVDAQNVTVDYVQVPDFSKSGATFVTLVLTDASGNSSLLESKLTIVPVRTSLTLEAGDKLPSIGDFLLDDSSTAGQSYAIELLTDMTQIPVNIPGIYPVTFRLKSVSEEAFTFDTQLEIRDTVAPVVKLKSLKAYTTSELSGKDFVAEASDHTELSFAFETEPDMTKEGTQEITVLATDLGGNTARGTTTLTLSRDSEPPVIRGVFDITAYQNRSISYKSNVSVVDNCDKDVAINVNADAVDLSTVGSYPVTYSATDKAGNHAEVSITVHVIEEVYSEDIVYGLADKVLSEILTQNMTDYEKLSAIYYWVRGNFGYKEMSLKDDWLQAAYYGFTKHSGDCYIYASATKALLDRAGIKNMLIDTLPIKRLHYWNLVDIGEGWHHYDTTPRRAGGVFLYLDDASIKKYSDAHDNSHIYDKTRFPDIP